MSSNQYQPPSDTEIIDTIERNNFVLKNASKSLGFRRGELRTLLKRNKNLGLMYQQRKEDLLDAVEARLFDLINEKNFNAIKFYLESQGQSRGYGKDIRGTIIDVSDETFKQIENKYNDDL